MADEQRDCALITNYGRALIVISINPQIRLRDLGDCLGITERAAQRIVSELKRGGYITARRVGRRVRYEIHLHRFVQEIGRGREHLGDFLQAVQA